MKKIKLFFGLLLLFSFSYSQKFHFGLHAGMIASKLKSDFNSAAKLANDKYLFRPTLELVFNFQVVKRIGYNFNTGLIQVGGRIYFGEDHFKVSFSQIHYPISIFT